MRNLIFLVLILFAGCYTVIKHPEISYKNSSQQIFYKSDCGGCHSASEISYFYEFMPSHVSSPWVYYNVPWWLEWAGNFNFEDSSMNKVRNFGIHRDGNRDLFLPPPPTRTPTGSGDKDSSSSNAVEKGGNSRISKDLSGVNSSGENARNQVNKQGDERKRNIGQRRK